MRPCSLLSLATAVPPHPIGQREAKTVARRAFRRKGLFDRLAGVFDNPGIAGRYLVAPHDWYEQPHGWEDRNRLYLDAAERMFIEAAGAAIAAAGLRPHEIAGVVTASTTGIATPTLEARVARQLGLAANVRRVPLFGLGCAAGVSGLAITARLAAADPSSHWLFVAVETCSISIRLDSDDPAAIVAAALFSDGCAAAVVRAGSGGLAELGGSAETQWPDSLGIMGWRVEDEGLGVVFDRAIPAFVKSEFAGAIDRLCADLGIARQELSRLCCHPGGPRVAEAIEDALGLGPGTLDLEREILREFGNMSAPTVLFVLKKLIDRGLPPQTLMTALGPGFTCAGLLVNRPS